MSRKSSDPSWYDPDARPFFFLYSKAAGFGFAPARRDDPLLYGGDYDGMTALPAAFALKQWYFQKDVEQYEMEWLVPFVEKLANGEDFTLEELKGAAAAAGCRVFHRSEFT